MSTTTPTRAAATRGDAPTCDRATLENLIDRVVRRTTAMDLAWDWPAGVAFYGVSQAWTATGKDEYLAYLKGWADERFERGLPKFTVNAVSIGHSLLTLHAATGDEKYLSVAQEMAEFLSKDAVRFGEGVFQHTVSQNYNFPEQAWADTLFMAALFLLRIGAKTGNKAYIADALEQYRWHETFLQDESSNLCFHAWDNIGKNNLSGVYWGRANAWIAITSAEALTHIDAMNPSFMRIGDALRDQLAALVRVQTPAGLWRTVLTDETAYEETSASAGIGAALVIYSRVFNYDIYQTAIARAFAGVASKIDTDGTVRGVSAGTAVMPDVQAYKDIPAKRIQGWGQGLTLAFLAALIAGC
jgi:unsaturated rhamnogalacturonyl hydrolase